MAFIDDDIECVEVASAVGMSAFHCMGVESSKACLRELGFSVGGS
jgi:hypothetical protein